ncbi:MAG: T9SS type A sorting domain-containing protein [Flavobacteriales bacterium]|nr:T9SS type A sorting domain-containing protein [Flavobacteriales bacterium]MBK7753111.1 T9SS type A sorting domain-containing protein [Flavobacteriales bacterium]
MVRTTILFLGSFFLLDARAQMVQQCCGTQNSTYLWGLPAASHTQCLYLPADLTGLLSGDIERLYWRYGNVSEDVGNSFTDLTIRLGQTTQTTFTNGNQFFTGLDTVLTRSSWVIQPGIEGDWFSIDLDTLFAYDSTKTLIVDVAWLTSTTNMGCLGGANNDQKLYSADNSSPTGNASSISLQDIGFDLELGTSIAEGQMPEALLWPVPAEDVLEVRLSPAPAHPGIWRVHDALGKPVFTGRYAQGTDRFAVNVAGLTKGLYFLEFQDDPGGMRTERFSVH